MANNFKITITAVDKATAIVKKINKATSNITRPIETISKSVASMGREVARNPIIDFTTKLAKKAAGAASALGKMITPLGALGAVTSVAGIMAIAEAWGKSGIAVTNASNRIDRSVGKLQGFRGAATAAGLSADSMQGSLVALSDTLQDASMGRNQQALMLLGRLGINISRGKDGIVDTAKTMNDLADAIQRQTNPQTQALIARAFGLEDMLPILQKGSKGLQEYMEYAKKVGAVDEEAAAANERLGKSWSRLKLSIEGATNAMSKGWVGASMNAVVSGWADILSGAVFHRNDKKPVRVDSSEGARIRSLHENIMNGGSGRDTGIKPIGNLPNPAAKSEALARNQKERLGIRSNNPMNLQPGGKEATYANPAAGIEAGARNLIKNYQGLTIDQIANKYTPANAPGNSRAATDAWAANVSKETGVARNAVPNLNDSKTLAPMLSAIIKSENGKNPYGKDMIEQAAQKVVVEVNLKGNTQGVTAVARNDAPNSPPPVIHYAMPSGMTS